MSARKSLYFLSPGNVSIREDQLAAPGPGQVVVRSTLSAVSSGTEILLYRGQFPSGLALDENIESLQGNHSFPLKYGYGLVGEVIELGDEVSSSWLGKRVFAFQPHDAQYGNSS
jgi:NADPH:quinone reductase-like Zn-dependent oxidoreductase